MAEQCERAGVPFVLVGGFAVNFHNVTRNTDDVDFLMTEENFEKVWPFLNEAGYCNMKKQYLCARLRRDVEPQGRYPDIDILFINPETFQMIQKDTQDMDLGEKKMKVVSLRHLMAMKLHSLKNNPSGREVPDMGDLLGLVQINRVDVHKPSFKEFCLKYANEEIYNRLVRLAEHG